jgi:hypothetical protein
VAQAQVLKNVFACLVHERQEAVVDLVRNLSHLDPGSRILLYNGGRDPELLRRRFSVNGSEPLVHPSPSPLDWGALHRFAIDCMRHALAEVPFDTLTIVDSDQLLLKPGYSETLTAFLEGRENVGMLGNAPGPQPMHTSVAPAVTAWRESRLWLPYCRRYPDGEAKFPHWTFWPSTVFTAAACRDLVRTFDEDEELSRTLAASRLWATEEILLPTLVALLGHEVVQSPCSYDLVRFRVLATPGQVLDVLRRPRVFWLHPVPRRLDHPLRRVVRERYDDYRTATRPAAAQLPPRREPLLTLPILERMRGVEGWLSDDEADLLIAGVARSLVELPAPHSIVEVGSYCGKSTIVLASVVRALRGDARVHSIDPHDGFVGSRDRGLQARGPTLERFRRSVTDAGVGDVVEILKQHSWETVWDRPVSFLHVDWLHDHESVSRDFLHFEPWLTDGAYVAFHDYAPYYPGVQRLVDDLLASGGYARLGVSGTMILLRRQAGSARIGSARVLQREPAPEPTAPLVSCIMATHNRAHLVPQAVASLLRQTHAAVELIVIDDGPRAPPPALPDDPRVHLVQLENRLSIGAKRNLGCELARGDLLANWDDDDWYAPWRIAYQVQQLQAGGGDICGLNRLIYYAPATGVAWRYAWPPAARPWLHDAVLLFTRDFWRRNPFPDTSMGIDCRILWTATPKRVLPLADERFYVGMVHGTNTSPKDTGNGLWRRCPASEAETLLGDDLLFYREALGEPMVAAGAGGG